VALNYFLITTGVYKMKKIALAGATLALVLAAGSASAANSMNSGTVGLSVSVVPATVTFGGGAGSVSDSMISGKYFVAKDMAVLGGVGFATGGPSGASTTQLRIMGGVRKYMNTNDFAPFIGGTVDYASLSTTPANYSIITVAAHAGAEYFLAKQFSVEGSVGFGFQSQSAAGTSATYIGTTTAGVGINLYF
jgi:hypothetical protein